MPKVCFQTFVRFLLCLLKWSVLNKIPGTMVTLSNSNHESASSNIKNKCQLLHKITIVNYSTNLLYYVCSLLYCKRDSNPINLSLSHLSCIYIVKETICINDTMLKLASLKNLEINISCYTELQALPSSTN